MEYEFCKTFIEALEERIVSQVAAKVSVHLEGFFKSQIKIVYTEKEAAEFLGVQIYNLQAWRKKGLINYCNYPLAKGDGLGSTFTYDLANLLDFRERYKVTSVPEKFEIERAITLFGLEIVKTK